MSIRSSDNIFSHLSLPLYLSQSVNLSLSLSLSYFWLPHSSHTFRLSCLQNSGHKDCDVQYAELDTAALASSPSPRSSAHTGPGDLVEYATIQPSSHQRMPLQAFPLRLWPQGTQIDALLSLVHPPFTYRPPFFMFHTVPLSAFLFSLGHFFFSPSLSLRYFQIVISEQYSNSWQRPAFLWRNSNIVKPKSSLHILGSNHKINHKQ